MSFFSKVWSRKSGETLRNSPSKVAACTRTLTDKSFIIEQTLAKASSTSLICSSPPFTQTRL